MQDNEIKIIGIYSASLSIIEIGLGSILHAASIPLAGQILSINQMTILSRASFKENSKTISLKISLISSLLKSLSPAGKKLTPMLAILAQGIFFSSMLTLFGLNYFGLIVAIIVTSLWAFLQPLILLYFFFGKTLIDVLNYFKKDFTLITSFAPSIIIKILFFSYILKVIITIIFSIKITKMSDQDFEQLQERLNVSPKHKNKKSYDNQLINAVFDLFQPIFIISFLLTALFLYYSESSYVLIIWRLLRPVILGLIIFYLVRIYPTEKIIFFLEKKGMTNISKSLKIALDAIKKNREL